MTLLQIKYAFECGKTGSISVAAQNLYTSTSNVSKILKSLEDDLGYSIFIRSQYGLIPTNEGSQFLRHAESILTECSQIENIEEMEATSRLTVSSMLSTYSCIAFVEIAKKYGNRDVHFQLNTETSSQCIAQLKNHLCDVAVVAAATDEDINIEHQLRHQNFTVEKIASLPVLVYMDHSHPILKKYTSEKDILAALYHYPYVESEFQAYLTPHPIGNYINSDKVIKIGEWQWRFQLLKEINAFMSGIVTPNIPSSYHDLFSITLPGADMSLFLVTRTGEIHSALVLEFCENIKAALNKDGRYTNELYRKIR